MTGPVVIDRSERKHTKTLGCGVLVLVASVFWLIGLVTDLWGFGVVGMIATGPLGLILAVGGVRAINVGIKPRIPRALVVGADGVSWTEHDKALWRFGWREIRGLDFKQVYYPEDEFDEEIDEPDYTMRVRLTGSRRQEVEADFTKSEVARIKEMAAHYAGSNVDLKQEATARRLPEFKPSAKSSVIIHPNEWSRTQHVLFYGAIFAFSVVAGVIAFTVATGEFRQICRAVAAVCLISPLITWKFTPRHRGSTINRTTLTVSAKGMAWHQANDPVFGVWWKELAELRLTPVGRRHQVELVPANSDFEIRHDDLAPLLRDGVYVLPHTFSPTATAQLRETLATMRPGVVSTHAG